MRLLSVNVVHAQVETDWGKHQTATAIDKRPVSGAVAVTAPGQGGVGLAGDEVVDTRFHGGADQAVYAYAREDYNAWEQRLGRQLRNGVFGENMTTEGVDINSAVIGERWRVGSEVLLEVSYPRIPCGVFRGWMGIKGWVATFTRVAEPGAYFRVLEPGLIVAGDAITVEFTPDHGVTVRDAFLAYTAEPKRLPRMLSAPQLPERALGKARDYVEKYGPAAVSI